MMKGDYLKLADFGMTSKLNNGKAKSGGTRAYNAPEVEYESYAASKASDIYSLGKTLERVLEKADKNN